MPNLRCSMYDELAKKPIFFERNRVFRVYKGGKLFHDFFGDEAIEADKFAAILSFAKFMLKSSNFILIVYLIKFLD